MTGVGRSGGILLELQSKGRTKEKPLTILPKKLSTFIDDCEACETREILYEYLIETAIRFKSVPSSIAVRPFEESHRVPACESDAYVWVEKNSDNTVKLYFAVENPQGVSAKALSVILEESLSGCTPDEIIQIDPSIVFQIFGNSLSMGKGLGLTGIVQAVKAQVKSLVS